VKKTYTKKHLFQTKYTTKPLTYLLTYRLRLKDINIVFKLYLEYLFIAQCPFINIKSKMCLMSLLVRTV